MKSKKHLCTESGVKQSFRSFPQFKNNRPFILSLKKNRLTFVDTIYAHARFSDNLTPERLFIERQKKIAHG